MHRGIILVAPPKDKGKAISVTYAIPFFLPCPCKPSPSGRRQFKAADHARPQVPCMPVGKVRAQADHAHVDAGHAQAVRRQDSNSAPAAPTKKPKYDKDGWEILE